jgi:hypothetical protein
VCESVVRVLCESVVCVCVCVVCVCACACARINFRGCFVLNEVRRWL